MSTDYYKFSGAVVIDGGKMFVHAICADGCNFAKDLMSVTIVLPDEDTISDGRSDEYPERTHPELPPIYHRVRELIASGQADLKYEGGYCNDGTVWGPDNKRSNCFADDAEFVERHWDDPI